MSRAEENSFWAAREQNYWKGVRSKKSLENEKIDNDFQMSLNEVSNRLDALEEERIERIKLVIETKARLSLINDAIEKETVYREQLRQKYHLSREMRNNESEYLWTQMRGWFREQKGEDPHAPDDKGPESEGLVLRNELPGLSSAADGTPVQRELTNGTGAMADRPEEASDKRSMGGLKCHNIETAKTPEVQPKSEPTNQLKLQEIRQVEKKIVPPGQPLPPHVYEPPSKGRWEQLSGDSSRGYKRRFQGQPDGFSKRQTTVTGQPVSNIALGNFEMTDPHPKARLNQDSYGTQGGGMGSGKPTATNSQQPSLETNRVASIHNSTISNPSSIMHSVAPIGSFETLERQGREAEAMDQRLRNVAIKAIQVADAHGSRVTEES
ncbi:hypothetical protein FMUND_12396 [Fusarium mundagurra]|uniref:Uncharacterized protein n=1 Tax=Fusarium mundagurra TaxID=1567541 RepID=A0A8H6D5I1_9HYPO|nr:hypothetical protein FMUND_12396 [Fusarium mundagurra]